ncbi:hypothetical protein [[Haemophilus] ducreyi]|uniref:hypothetical protein n=1 Tax=Haemophilus ducreyi TaxID=730 RepID=UPI000A8D8030|nr:hypothetical protein [[Haemophilus] ducreyi]
MKIRNMENSQINTDLAVMDYEEFKCFMKELATMYSDISEDGYPLLYDTLQKISKAIATRPFEYHIIYGASEIDNKQVVIAIFELQFNETTIGRTSNGFCRR